MSSYVPEPLADPETQPTSATATTVVRSRVSQRRLGVGLFVVGACWVFANSVIMSVLLAAKLAILAPDDKVKIFGAVSAVTAVTATLALFFWGAVSDLTRHRLGRRTPWIIAGGVGGAVGLMLLALASTVPLLIGAVIFYTLAMNSLPAAVLAVFPDRVPVSRRGAASAVYGGAQVIAGALGSIIAGRFIGDPDPMLFVAAAVMLVGGVAFPLIAPDFPSTDMPRAKLDLRGLADAFRFPAHAPDFYWAFAGRFLLLLGYFMVSNFQLYILTDYIGLTNDEAGGVYQAAGLASLVTITIGTLASGPISDKLGRRKAPIFVASLLFAFAVVVPLVWPTATGMIVFAAVAGLGLGSFLSVDSALMTEVLPSQESRGKDMGILNTANTVPGIIAPLVTSSIVSTVAGYPLVFITSLVIMTVGAFSIFKIKSVR